MYNLNLFFIQREFFVELWNDEVLLDKTRTENASKDLLDHIGNLLKKHNLLMQDIARFNSLSGPGSFSSIRIAYSTLSALRRVFANVQYSSYYVEDLFNNDEFYNDMIRSANNADAVYNLLIRLNKNIFLVFDKSWEVKFRKDLDKRIEYRMLYESEIGIVDDLYDLNITLICNTGERLNCMRSNIIKEPFYVYMPVGM